MFNITHTVNHNVKVTKEQAKEIVKKYLKLAIIGEGCYITEDKELEHWTSWPHGSGTTSNKGAATELQILASQILVLIK